MAGRQAKEAVCLYVYYNNIKSFRLTQREEKEVILKPKGERDKQWLNSYIKTTLWGFSKTKDIDNGWEIVYLKKETNPGVYYGQNHCQN